jgi:hypothetical protein
MIENLGKLGNIKLIVSLYLGLGSTIVLPHTGINQYRVKLKYTEYSNLDD